MTMPEGEDSNKKLPPLSQAEKDASAADDTQSREEAKQLGSGLSAEKLKRQSEENEADRTERFRDHFERLAIVTLYVVWACLVIVGVAWVYHLLAPPEWMLLPEKKVRQLQNIVTGGLLIGIAGGHLKRRLGSG